MNKPIILLLVFVAAVSAFKYELELKTGNKDFKKVRAVDLTVVLKSNGKTDELTLPGTILEKNTTYKFIADSKYRIEQIEDEGTRFGWNIHRLPTPDGPNPVSFRSLRVIPAYLGNGPNKENLARTYCGDEPDETLTHDNWHFLNRC